MDIASGTITKQITVAEQSVSVPCPFVEGHVLKINEAPVLNQTLHENIRNNCTKKVNAAITAGADPAAVQKVIDDYIASYDFGARRGGGFRPTDPLQAEKLRITKDLVLKAMKKQNIKRKDVETDAFNARVQGVLDKNDAAITKRATANLKASADLESSVLESLEG